MAMVIMKRGRGWREMKDDIDVGDDEEYQVEKKKAKSFSTKNKIEDNQVQLGKSQWFGGGKFQ